MHPTRSTHGFTLLEILIAMMILAIALPILFQLFSGTLRAVKQSRDHAHAVAMAQHKLEELTVLKAPPLEPESGETPEGLFWERTVLPIDVHLDPLPINEDDINADNVTPPTPLYEATVSVRWNADASSPSTSVHTLMTFATTTSTPLDPEFEESGDDALP